MNKHTPITAGTRPHSHAPSVASHSGQQRVEALFKHTESRGLRNPQYKEELFKLAAVEQEVFRWLVAQLQRRSTDSIFCNVKVVVLKEYIRQHVRDEVCVQVCEMRGRGLNICELGTILQNVKQNLHAELTG